MSELRDFIYLDTVRLRSFISQIQGGLVNEVNERTKETGELTGDLSAGIPSLIGGNLDVTKGRENERQKILQMTDPAYFEQLYRYLKDQNKIIDITGSSLKTRNVLRIGDFIEMGGMADPPVVENWIGQVQLLFNYLEKHFKALNSMPKVKLNFSHKELQQFKALMNLFVDYLHSFRRDTERQHLRISAPKQEYNIWCGIIKDFVVIRLNTILPANVRIVGKVERILDEGEVWQIVDFITGEGGANDGQQIDPKMFVDTFNALVSTIGRPKITEMDFQVRYPDVFVIPIAVYQ